MRSIRLSKDWPKRHDDFQVEHLQVRNYTQEELVWDFFMVHQGGRIATSKEITKGKNRFGFYANNEVREVLTKINWNTMKWMAVGNFAAITLDLLFYGYEINKTK